MENHGLLDIHNRITADELAGLLRMQLKALCLLSM